MKTVCRIGRAIVLCVIAIWGHAMLNAQQVEPCVPDCPGSQWGSVPSQVVFPIPVDGTIPGYTGGCFMTIDYTTRLACGQWHDFQILRMRIDVSAACGPVFTWMVANQGTAALNAWTRNMYNLIDDRIAQIEFMKHYNSQPSTYQQSVKCGVGSDLEWRASRASCVDWVIECDGNGHYVVVLLRCPGASCCLQSFSICYDPATAQPVVLRTGSITSAQPCQKTPFGDMNCFGGLENELCIPLCGED
jgi:hypothetical protein